VVDVLFLSVCGSRILVTGAASLSLFTIKMGNIYLANSWSSVWRALESAHKFYSINFYSDVSTFELS